MCPPRDTPTIKSVISQRYQFKYLTHNSLLTVHHTYLGPTGVPCFYSQYWPNPFRSLASVDSDSMLILDPHLDRDKLFLSLIFIQNEILPTSRTPVPYPFASDPDISADNLGLAEIISVSDQVTWHLDWHFGVILATCCHSQNTSLQLPSRFYYLGNLRWRNLHSCPHFMSAKNSFFSSSEIISLRLHIIRT